MRRPKRYPLDSTYPTHKPYTFFELSVMCGILAILAASGQDNLVAAELHEALYLLQHRGQGACGIATFAAGGKIYQCKGMVRRLKCLEMASASRICLDTWA